jgi:hypothetical protein
MRGLTVLAAFLAFAAAGAATAGSTPRTALTVTYAENSAKPADKVVWMLRCDPAGGTLKRPGVACRRLDAGGRALFAPVRKDEICTQIYGGPQTALVVGTVDGRRVWARFQRRNGCEIARWNRLSPWLLPPGGVN